MPDINISTIKNSYKSNARTYSGLFAQFLCVYLHASPRTNLLSRVPTRLLDETAYQFVLQLGHVQGMLQGVLSEHDVIVDAGLIDGNR